jgi:hypothetical protein
MSGRAIGLAGAILPGFRLYFENDAIHAEWSKAEAPASPVSVVFLDEAGQPLSSQPDSTEAPESGGPMRVFTLNGPFDEGSVFRARVEADEGSPRRSAS